jgi:hypothetical protein
MHELKPNLSYDDLGTRPIPPIDQKIDQLRKSQTLVLNFGGFAQN